MMNNDQARSTACCKYGLLIIPAFLTIVLSSGLCLAAGSQPEAVRLRVFALFRIEQIAWSCSDEAWLQVSSGNGGHSLPVSAADTFTFSIRNGRLAVEQRRGTEPASTLESDSPVTLQLQKSRRQDEFLLSVPGRIQRYFRGVLELRIEQDELIAVVTEDFEQLAGEVGAAEMSFPLLLPALEAQVIVARSFLVTHRGRHAAQGYDFCDTTHCQYTRGSRISDTHRRALRNTRGMVLSYLGKPAPAYYAAVCGGSTTPFPPLTAVKLGYPNILVRCPSCTRPNRTGEKSELPVSPFSGATNGHSLGLCQAGALEMARQGRTRDGILRHFFPYCMIVPVGKK